MNNETQSIIIYHSRAQQAVDEMLWQDGGSVYVFIFMCAGIAGVLSMTAVDKLWRGKRYNSDALAYTQCVVGTIVSALTAYSMWV